MPRSWEERLAIALGAALDPMSRSSIEHARSELLAWQKQRAQVSASKPPRSAIGRLICWVFDAHAWFHNGDSYRCRVCGETREDLR